MDFHTVQFKHFLVDFFQVKNCFCNNYPLLQQYKQLTSICLTVNKAFFLIFPKSNMENVIVLFFLLQNLCELFSLTYKKNFMSLFKENKKVQMQKSACMNAKKCICWKLKILINYNWLDHSWINNVCDNNSILQLFLHLQNSLIIIRI